MKCVNNKDRLQIYKNNELIANIFANDENLFVFDTIPSNNTISKNYVFIIDTNLWHARLGHFYNNDIKDFVIEHTKYHNDKNWRQCKITKLKRKPFYSSPNNASKPMELVHSDVVGKLEISYNDFNYYVTFLDDFSRKIWVYLIKNKSDVPNIFIKFHKFISNTTSYKIINFKSDNGTEYINKTLTTYLENFGINFIHSVHGYPQQNDRAERLNQTLNRYASTLLNSAKLPYKFWDSAILCAAYLYNLNPHQSINNKIPNELFFNKSVDIFHLKVFGCKAFFYNNHKTNKFENNSKPGIFLGYASDSLGYKILDISTNSIVTSRDVYFMEDMPGTIIYILLW